MEHRRTDRRYERCVDISITYDGTTLKSQTRNVSLGGVFVETDAVLPFGMRVSVTFHISTQAEAVEVEGQVRWSELEDGAVRGVGIRFEGLRARDVWALNKLFETPLAMP